MGINKIQFQKGLSMAEFMENYGTEDKYHSAVVASRWPAGFVCPKCSGTHHLSVILVRLLRASSATTPYPERLIRMAEHCG